MKIWRLLRIMAAAAAMLTSAGADPALAWLQRFEDQSVIRWTSRATDVDATGDVVVGGERRETSSTGSDFAVVKLDGTTGSQLWYYGVVGREVLDVAMTPSGDVVAGGRIYDAGTNYDAGIVKLDGATGAQVWQHTIATTSTAFNESVTDVALDAAGDVIAIGLAHEPGLSPFTVVKVDGATGAGLWSTAVPGGLAANAVAVDASGDVVAVGKAGLADDEVFFVVKLDGGTGAELWRVEIDPGNEGAAPGDDGFARDVAIDSAGNVLAGGFTRLQAGIFYLNFFTVMKLDGATGTETWRWDLFRSEGAEALRVDAADDVIATGPVDESFNVVKLDGTTGTLAWRYQVDGTEPSIFKSDVPLALELGATGSVYAAGYLENESTELDAIVVRLDGGTGTEVWRHERNGNGTGGFDQIRALAVDPSGDPVAVGHLSDDDRPHDFVATKLDQDDGSASGSAGSKLVMKDPGDPDKRFITFVLKDDLLQSPSPGSVHDPRTAGATIAIRNPTTLEEATFALPAGPTWQAVGTPPGVKGYRYKDKAGLSPCAKVILRPGKKLIASCKAKTGGIPFTLDEPSQGSIAVSLRLGAGAPQCATFGGLLIADQPGLFKAKAAPATPSCD